MWGLVMKEIRQEAEPTAVLQHCQTGVSGLLPFSGGKELHTFPVNPRIRLMHKLAQPIPDGTFPETLALNSYESPVNMAKMVMGLWEARGDMVKMSESGTDSGLCKQGYVGVLLMDD